MNTCHGHGHPVDLVFVAHLVVAEGTVAAKQLVEHAAEGEPVGRGVVGSPALEHLRGHVAMGADAGVGPLPREVARQTKVTYPHVAILVQ